MDAIEHLMNAGAKAILITPSDTKAIVPTIERARKAGILVIALDTPLDPPSAADATFATDNQKAGELIGAVGREDARRQGQGRPHRLCRRARRPAFCRSSCATLASQRALASRTRTGSNTDTRPTSGSSAINRAEARKQRAARRWRRCSRRIRTSTSSIRSTSRRAAGAYGALKAAGKAKDALIVSVDGGCPGVKNVAAGVIGATAQQYPLLMASMGVEAAVEYAKTGKKPEPSPGLDFFNTGVSLVTDKPVDGVPSISSKEGLAKCWG